MEKQLLLKLNPEFKTFLKVEAYKRDMTMKDFIIEAVKKYVKEEK